MPRTTATQTTASSRLDTTLASATGTAVATASAHAKAILLGEHAVVHGAPAIVLPVHALELSVEVTRGAGPLRVESELYRGPADSASARLAAPITAITETLKTLGLAPDGLCVRISGHVPPERGLGSSAAVAAALSAAVATFAGVELTAEEHFELIQAAERVAHGSPSGLDARGVVAGGPVWFEGGTTRELPVGLGTSFVVADTGVFGGTRSAVAAVRRLREEQPARVEAILEEIAQITRDGAVDLELDRRAELGERMTACHRLLSELTVSSAELDGLVDAALGAGALGAKLTGGGRGGCALVLAPEPDAAPHIAAALEAAGAARTWTIDADDLAV